jgi:hypothetical protein
MPPLDCFNPRTFVGWSSVAQFDGLVFGEIDKQFERAMGAPRISRMGDRFLLHGFD